MKKQPKKLKFVYSRWFLLIVGLLGAIIGVIFVDFTNIHLHTTDNKSDNMGSMMTLLSIIVTLGVAYSFYSIFQFSNEISSIKSETKRIRLSVHKKSKTLSFQSKCINCRLDLYKRNNGIGYEFQHRHFLLALKLELECILYILQNAEYLGDEVESSIGAKRSFVANDILTCIETITSNKVSKFSEGELNNSIHTIIATIEKIKFERNGNLWNLIHPNEQVRYKFMFQKITTLTDQIKMPQFILTLPKEDIYKLHFYHRGIWEGKKSDTENHIDFWINRFIEKESGEKDHPTSDNFI